jgi:hypothetical protein
VYAVPGDQRPLWWINLQACDGAILGVALVARSPRSAGRRGGLICATLWGKVHELVELAAELASANSGGAGEL